MIDTVELDNLIGELDMFQREHEAKEKERMEKQYQQQQQHHQHHQQNGNNEYQVPKNSPSIIQTQKTLHNDSIISTSTTITGTFSHAFSNDECSERNVVDKISLNASLNYSITSNTSMMTNTTLSDFQKFNISSDNENRNYWNDNNNDDDLSADTGFENPSFRHLNDTNIVLMRDDDLPPTYYSQNATDVVVLRSKSNSMGSNNNSITDLSTLAEISNEQKQRLSSFKVDNNNLTPSTNGSPSHYFNSSNLINNNNNNSIPNVNKGSLHSSFGALMYGQSDEPLTSNKVNVNNNVNVVTSNKPAVTPRPASLLSGIFYYSIISLINYYINSYHASKMEQYTLCLEIYTSSSMIFFFTDYLFYYYYYYFLIIFYQFLLHYIFFL